MLCPPEEDFIDALLAKRVDDGHDKEGQPTDDEGPSDNGECLGRLLLPLGLQRNVLLLLLLFQNPRTGKYKLLTLEYEINRMFLSS